MERSPGSGGPGLRLRVSAATNQLSRYATEPQQTYFYRVRAVNSGGFSPYSNLPVRRRQRRHLLQVTWCSTQRKRQLNPAPGLSWLTELRPEAVAFSNPDAGAPKRSTALANPTDYFEMTFNAQAGTIIACGSGVKRRMISGATIPSSSSFLTVLTAVVRPFTGSARPAQPR